MSPSNNNSTPVTAMPSNNSLTRSQEGNEQTSNPFDVIIKKSKFPGRIKDKYSNKTFVSLRVIAIFGSKRPPKDKKVDKKLSTDNKSRKIPHIRRPRDELNGNNLQANYSEPTDNNDDFVHLSATSKKNRC